MKAIIVLFYIVMLFVLTCTESLFLFLTEQKLQFHFTRQPNLSDFLINDLSSVSDITYVMQKLGHFIYFFFLAMLFYWAFKRWLIVVLFSIGLAFLTESAQLFFSRSGRLLDVVYDLAGLMVFVVLYLSYRLMEWLLRKGGLFEVRRH